MLVNRVDINKLDLNLLLILKTLIREKHISNTALTLNTSQSSVSRALSKLRQLFNDPILIRVGGQYELSSKARLLESELNHVLLMIEGLINKQTFTPETSRATIKLFGLPPQMSVFLETIIGDVRKQAPYITLDIDSLPKPQFKGLVNGEVHFVVSAHTPPSSEDKIHRLPLFTRDFVLVMSHTHALANEEITIDKLKNCHFGQISMQGESALSIASSFKRLGVDNVSTPIQIKHFYNIGGIVENSDIIFYLPQHFAQDICHTHSVVVRQAPMELKLDFSNVYLYWHQRFHDDPLCQWFRQLVKHKVFIN